MQFHSGSSVSCSFSPCKCSLLTKAVPYKTSSRKSTSRKAAFHKTASHKAAFLQDCFHKPASRKTSFHKAAFFHKTTSQSSQRLKTVFRRWKLSFVRFCRMSAYLSSLKTAYLSSFFSFFSAIYAIFRSFRASFVLLFQKCKGTSIYSVENQVKTAEKRFYLRF